MQAEHLARVRILYKTIFKLHRGLPGDLKILGDNYARDEFKRHKKCKPTETALFMMEWTKYAMSLAQQLGFRGIKTGTKVGSHLTEDKLEELSEEQIAQLYELLQAAQGQESNSITAEDILNNNKHQ